MKIGYVLDDGLDRPGGVQQYILTVGQYMQKKGHEVRYLVGETKRKDISGVYSLTKNIVVRFSGNKLSTPLPASKKNIKNILESEKFDILHIQVPYSPFCAARVINLAGPKTAIIGTFHILPYNLLGRAGTGLLGGLLTHNLNKFDAFLSVSEPAQSFAKEAFRISSRVLPNPVNINKYQPKKQIRQGKDQLKLIFLGRLVPRKGCLQLLKVLAKIRRDESLANQFTLDICGDGPQENELKKFLKQNKLDDCVRFQGFVSEAEKISYLQHADMAIFPSSGGESFGIVLIEAMAAGSGVVLGGNNPGYVSVLATIPESILNVHDLGKMEKQIKAFIKEPQLRMKLHELQQKHVKKFDINVVGSQLVELYRDCKKTHAS